MSSHLCACSLMSQEGTFAFCEIEFLLWQRTETQVGPEYSFEDQRRAKTFIPPTQVSTHPTIWSSILSPASPPSASTSSCETRLKIKREAKHLSGWTPPQKQEKELSVLLNTRGAGHKKSERCLLRRRCLNAIKALFLRKNTALSYLVLFCQQFDTLMSVWRFGAFNQISLKEFSLWQHQQDPNWVRPF